MGREDEVRLLIPALPEYARLARLTVAGLGSRMGFSYDEVEDLRMAVDELCHWLIGGREQEGTLTLTFLLHGDAIDAEGRAVLNGAPPTPMPDQISDLSRLILDAVVDDYSCGEAGTERWFRIQKRKAG